jgi:REP element-mobilizing transposase RayT
MRDRTNPRHPTFDYRSPAAYFVTLCTYDRRCLFGTVRRGRMVLNACGRIAAREWTRSEAMRDEIVLDAFVVMPISTAGRFTKRSGVNHLHGIICIVPPDVDDVSPRGYDLDVGATSMPTKRIPNDDVETTGRSVRV